MNIQDISKHLKNLVQKRAGEASKIVATNIRDEIIRNTSASKGFKDDPYRKQLSPVTIKLKKERGTYVSRRSTLRDTDRSIEKLKVGNPVRGKAVIDFRTTGKGELFFAHHHGTKPPSTFDPFIPSLKEGAYGAKGAPRSIIPLHDDSIPFRIHEIAAQVLLRESKGLPKITVSSKYNLDQAPF
jgi:hypothetical protein